jgi:hypothetical protein
VRHVQDEAIEALTRASWKLDEAGAELIGELVMRVRTRRVPMTGALTRKLGTGRGMKPRLVWPVRR